MSDTKPTFEAQERLARYIEPMYRQGNRRAKVAAFLDDKKDSNGLSVNSLEIHSEHQIASIYSEKFEDGARPVAMCIHTIEQYNQAAEEANLSIRFSQALQCWSHTSSRGEEVSYKHDPKAKNDSHSLVRFTTAFGEFQAFRFARRMAYKPTYTYF